MQASLHVRGIRRTLSTTGAMTAIIGRWLVSIAVRSGGNGCVVIKIISRHRRWRALPPYLSAKTAAASSSPNRHLIRIPGGFIFAIPWTVSALDMPPFWLGSHDSLLLKATAMSCHAHHPGAFNLEHFGARCWLGKSVDREVLVLEWGCRRQLIEIVSGTLLDGPVKLGFHVDGWMGLEAQIQALADFSRHAANSGPRCTCRAVDGKVVRLATLLRVHDARQAGVRLREIGQFLIDEAVIARDWRGPSDYLKSRVRRAVARAHDLADGQLRVPSDNAPMSNCMAPPASLAWVNGAETQSDCRCVF